MPVRLWSVALGGDSFAATMFVDWRGRIVVSTTEGIESAGPDGISRNFHAHRAYAFEPDGRAAWSVPRVDVLGQAPDGTYVATDDHDSYVVLSPSGHETARRTSVTSGWKLLGWRDDQPVLAKHAGCWVAPHIYAVSGCELQRRDHAGNLVGATNVPRDLFEAQYSKRPELASLPSAMLFPSAFELAYQHALDRFIGWWSGPLAWVMCLRRDGLVEWVRLLNDACCNTACFVGETVVHASSCGARLSFLTIDGAVIQVHEVRSLLRLVASERFAYAIATDALHAFDERGERLWSVDIPDLAGAAAVEGALYTLSGNRDAVQLTAFAT